MFPSGGKQKVSILQHSVPVWYPETGSGPQAQPREYLKGPCVTAENFSLQSADQERTPGTSAGGRGEPVEGGG